MKSLNYLILGAAALTLASCSQDDIMNSNQGDGNFAITVKLPADLGTRAEQNQGVGYYGQGYQATELKYALYEVDENGNVIEDAGFPVSTGTAQFADKQLETTVYFNLANGKYYSIAFFAESETAQTDEVYDFNTSTGVLTVKYENMTSDGTNEDAYDCYYKLHETGKIGGSLNQTVVLTRPVAQINWGTSDYDADAITDQNAFGDDPASSLETTFTAELYTTFNLFNREVGNPQTVTLGTPDAFSVPNEENFPIDDYDYVAMQYVLAPVESDIVDLNLTISSSTGNYNDAIVVNSAPIQANYRTNIYGTLLTDDLNITVVKDPIWGNPDYDITEDTAAFLDAIKGGGNITLTGDVYLPSRVSISGNTNINFNGYTIYGPSTGVAAILVNGKYTLTLEGEGGIAVSGNETYLAVWTAGGGNVVVNGGTYTSTRVNSELFYISDGGGTVTINGGSFKGGSDNNGLLNCQDGCYTDGTAKFIVNGGIFYGDFNPAASQVEPGGNVNWVSSGYTSTQVTMQNGQKAWVVVPEGYQPIVNGANGNTTDIKNGGNWALSEDITYQSGNYVPLTKNTNLNLNGYTLTSYGNASTGDAVVVGNGANVTISNGSINPSLRPNPDGSSATINLMTSTGGQLTLDNVNVIGDMYPVMLTSSSTNSNITINSGNFTFTNKWTAAEYTDKLACVYVTGQGTITINGGTFGMPGVHSEFLLNIQDNLRYPNTDKMPNQIITVKGGTFINFNPANNRAEGEGTNFVAEGYTVTSKKVGNDTYYTVVKAN